MSNDELVNEVMSRLKEQGFLMINEDFIDQLIITLHANVTIINNGNNPVLWGNAGQVTNLISAISPNNTNNKQI